LKQACTINSPHHIISLSTVSQDGITPHGSIQKDVQIASCWHHMHDFYVMLAVFFSLCVRSEPPSFSICSSFSLHCLAIFFFFFLSPVATVNRCFCAMCSRCCSTSTTSSMSAILSVFLLDLTQAVSQSAIRLLTFVSPIPHLFHTIVSAWESS